MAVPLLPESAPFTPAQRAWLNGFFAGLLGLEEAPGPGAQSGAPRAEPGAVASGAAAPATAGAVKAAADAPEGEEEFPWHDPAMPLDERLQLAEGKPLERVLMAAMAQLDCGACGYRCRTYSEAIARGEEKRLTLCAPGGRATALKLKEILARLAAAPPEAGSGGANGAGAAQAAPDRPRRAPARLVRSERLNRDGSAKDTRHVVLDISGSGLVYEPGDSLGVDPENCPELVEEVLRALGTSGAEPVELAGEPVPLREALLSRRAITRPGVPQLELLARSAGDPGEARALRRLLEAGGEDPLEGRELIDLLVEFPSARPSPGELVSALEPLSPRLYSISSSPRAHPGEVHLTVGVVRYERRGRARKGVASTFLAERAEAGRPLLVFVHGAHAFRLPPSGSTPIIMIGPGTGIAPFRAFLEERRALGARGANWLFFGGQREASDFLYRDELLAFRREGLLTRLDTAFSRDQAEKVYVQHRLLLEAEEVWAWLGEGAHLYVCGDARRMARDVDLALQEVAVRAGGLGREEARAHLRALARAGRYQRDVY